RSARHHRRACRRGNRRHRDLVRPSRGACAQRSGSYHARGPADGDPEPRGGGPGIGDDRRHGTEADGTRAWAGPMTWLRRHVRPEQIRELSLLLLIAVAILAFGSLIDGYYTFRTFNRIASSVAIITVVGVGQTLVVLTRNIDLSVGSIVGFTAYFVGTLIAAHNGVNPVLAVVIAMAIGAALGAVNGVLVAWGEVPAVVVTLGTLAIYRGVLVDLSGAKTVTTDSLPQWLINLPLLNVAPIGQLDIRAPFVFALIIVVVFQLGAAYLTFARRLYAIGSNPEAAQLIGLPMKSLVFLTFVVCGALSGLGGFMTLARFGNITVEAGRGLELSVSATEIWRRWETLMLALLIAIVAVNSLSSQYFLSVGNFVNLFQLSIEKSIVVITMTLVIIGGEIDLSVAS